MNYYDINQVCDKLGWGKTQARLWIKRLGLGIYQIGADGRARKMLTDADIDKLRGRIDGRTTRWARQREAANG